MRVDLPATARTPVQRHDEPLAAIPVRGRFLKIPPESALVI
jgi:hypothetical protein